jgi:hypothetical protein
VAVFLAILLALGVLLLFLGPTIGSYVFTRRVEPMKAIGITVAVWAVKLILVLVALYLVHGLDFYDHKIFAITLAAGAIICTTFEMFLFKNRANYQPPVTPQSEQPTVWADDAS